jgi:hypothetical protein
MAAAALGYLAAAALGYMAVAAALGYIKKNLFFPTSETTT